MPVLLASTPSFDIVGIVIGAIGGLALFLYGMHKMSGRLQVVAGESLKTLLSKLTTSRFTVAITGAIAIFLLIGCSPYSQVNRQPLSRIAVTEKQQDLVRSQRSLTGEPLARLGGLLDSAHGALTRLSSDPADEVARSDYNFAVGRIVEVIQEAGLEPWNELVRLPLPEAATGERKLTARLPKLPPALSLSEFQLKPADRYRFWGEKVERRTIREGIGAPVIGAGRNGAFIERDPFILGDDLYHGMTALVRFDGSNVELEILDPLDVETVELGGQSFALGADFTAPMALKMAEMNVRKFELSRMFRPDRYNEAARLALLQPYDPDRIPVLFIHGLGNSPATWVPLVSYLRDDAVLRNRYQFWFFSHPTGIPYPVSAASLRRQLDEIGELHRDHKKIVVVGHSMGGMISRLLITDPGARLWDAFYEQPPGEIPFSEETRSAVTRTLIFEPRGDISRVILVSASLRGSYDATGFIGRLGARLIGNPIADDRISREALAYLRGDVQVRTREHLPNSVDVLDPDSHWLQIVNELPLDRSVPYHSLMGDRGLGGNLDRTEPQSSDGIVPFWSAHLEGVETEKIVPSGHWSHLHPEGMAEIRRILLSHLE